ncbi:MAG: hypothetical protein DRI86_07645 [Bacteroidetes bacterium]|nr:MAG: hypothetical protein DRI86_07645 [Bacteroidota bacterium]
MLKYISILLLASLVLSCNLKKDDRKVIAEVYDYKLYEEDLNSQIPKGLSEQERKLFVDNFIIKWSKDYSILNKAANNSLVFNDEESDIDKQVEDYRNSLIVYSYQRRLVEQKLDTNVSYDEIKEFYSNHKSEFTLKDDIVQVSFIKLDNNSENIKQTRKLLKSKKEEDEIKLKNIAEDKAVNYFLDKNTWILFDDLLKEVPLRTYNRNVYFSRNKYVEVKDSLFTYMLRINNYRIRDNISPLNFEYNRIRSIIINMRKIALVEKMENDVYYEALENGAIKIFN